MKAEVLLVKKYSRSKYLTVLIFFIAFLAPWTASWIRLPLRLKLAEGIAFVFLYFWILNLLIVRKIWFPPGSLQMVSFVGFSLLSLILSPPPYNSSFQWAQGVYQPGFYNLTVVARQVLYFLLFIGLCNMLRCERRILLTLKGYIWGGVIAALVGLVQITLFLIGKSTIGIHTTPWDPVPRVLGIFNEPGPCSTFLATVVILLTAIILFRVKLFKNKLTLYGAWITVSVGLIMTFGSRGFIEAIIGIFYLVLAASKNRFKSIIYVLCAISVVIILLVLVYPPVFTGSVWVFEKVKAELQLDPAKAYSGGRKAGLYIAPRMFFYNPILGIGIGNYPFLRNEFAGEIPQVSHLDLPGNVFLELLAETGVLGYLAFLWLVLSIILYVRKGYQYIYKHQLPNQELVHALIAASLGILIDLTVSSSLYFIYVWIIPALLISLVRTEIGSAMRVFREELSISSKEI